MELLALYQQAENPGIPNLIFQEYIPDSCAEDWIFHGYCNPTKRLAGHCAASLPNSLSLENSTEPSLEGLSL